MGLEVKQFTELLPRILQNPKILLKEEKSLANAIPLLSFFAPFGELVFGPILLYLENKREKTDKKDTRKSVYQELIGQSITVTTHATSFILGGMLARRMLPKLNHDLFTKNSDALNNGETLACIGGAFLGTTFVRPLFTAKFLHKKEDQSKDSGSQDHDSKPLGPSFNPYFNPYNTIKSSSVLSI